ncbi:MAG TPA: ABC transporter permease [Candidatus Acidoferrales bacterium]|nr:ABC transporter permease [Candidatus Acidoferrales bacterium]
MAPWKWLSEIGRRMGMFLRRNRFDREMDEEMRLHLELREKELRENAQREIGVATEKAYTEARKTFGNTLLMREASHDAWGWTWLEQFVQDLRYAFRMLRKAPGFAAVAVLTLALGIGANTAIFSVVNAIYLSPLPFPNARQVYVVSRIGNLYGGEGISPAIFAAWRERQEGAFEHLTLIRWMNDSTLTGFGDPLRYPSMGISVDFLEMLGVHPVLGRDFLPEEGVVGGPNVVMLSSRLWRERFGSDANAIGRSITLDDQPYTIVGVLPAGFSLPIGSKNGVDLWFPARIPATTSDVGNGSLLCLGVLKPGVKAAQAESALTPTLAALREKFPKMFMAGERVHLIPFRELLNRWAGSAPLLLFGAVGLVLLIACANVASLTLARSATRQREIGVRTAIGASRGRIVRQLLTESVLLAVLGGILGVAACYASFQSVVALIPVETVHVGAFQIDPAVLAFAFLLSVLTGIIFGLVPALGSSRVDLGNSLKEATAQGGAGHSGRMRSALACGELAVSLVLLVGAALALESFGRLMNVNPGFDSSNVLTFGIQLTGKRYAAPTTRAAFFDEAFAQLSALPGVEDAAAVDTLPLNQGSDILFSLVGGTGAAPPGEPLAAYIRIASPDYFRTLRIPLVRGREFAPADNAAGLPVIVINEAMANKFWPGSDPIGQQVWIGKPMGPQFAEPTPRQIVGIVGDIHESSLAQAGGQTMFIPYAQTKWNDNASFVVRTRRAPMQSLPDARAAFHSIDANLPLLAPETMEAVAANSLSGWRFRAILLGVFGALALVIAAIGVYGVISYSVAQRTHEIGVRMALGAQRRDLLRLVIGKGALLAGIGIAIGIGAAVGLTRLMASMLYGVTPTDPLTLAAVATLLLLVALLACYIPARRAMKVDPMVALRYE